MKLGLFRCQEGDHLLIAVHHLVIDGVSWRILLEDIAAAYEQLQNGEAIRLPKKTDSYLLWAEQLNRYAESQEFEAENQYWFRQKHNPQHTLPKDNGQETESGQRQGNGHCSMDRRGNRTFIKKRSQGLFDRYERFITDLVWELLFIVGPDMKTFSFTLKDTAESLSFRISIFRVQWDGSQAYIRFRFKSKLIRISRSGLKQ